MPRPSQPPLNASADAADVHASLSVATNLEV